MKICTFLPVAGTSSYHLLIPLGAGTPRPRRAVISIRSQVSEEIHNHTIR